MGTSTLLLEDGVSQVLFDGYFSRPPLAGAFAGRVSPNCSEIASGLARPRITKPLEALFVAHSHVDHALDAAEIAGMTGAPVIGSESVQFIALGHGLPLERTRVAQNWVPYCVGEFRITPITTPHSTSNIAKGDIASRVSRRDWAYKYRSSENFAFLIEHRTVRLLLYPSAAYSRGGLRNINADIVFLGIGGLGRKDASFVTEYWSNVVRPTHAQHVFPIHWDNFGLPLALGLRPMPWPLDNVPRSRMRRLSKVDGVEMGNLPTFEAIFASSVIGAPLKQNPEGENQECERI